MYLKHRRSDILLLHESSCKMIAIVHLYPEVVRHKFPCEGPPTPKSGQCAHVYWGTMLQDGVQTFMKTFKHGREDCNYVRVP